MVTTSSLETLISNLFVQPTKRFRVENEAPSIAESREGVGISPCSCSNGSNEQDDAPSCRIVLICPRVGDVLGGKMRPAKRSGLPVLQTAHHFDFKAMLVSPAVVPVA